ncbi:Tat (twin-arginine translocation) pathway signal sequence [Chitinophaga niabensis]|uniref:Tat (Twin-arginine translocation) pathway signal sequence n=2 Tax=Chitinophaga niabensis TaxID=536979 RepID=A0A1N6DA51_9BACT|nr:Tat (twin-arginine translocation) pathway signal sequence [Chitinophaga niabensis]
MMSSNRRNFLRQLAVGTGALAAGIPTFASSPTAPSDRELRQALDQSNKQQRFNMSGYAAPKIDKVRIGFIGQGMRGPGAVQRMSFIDGVEIVALCDLLPERATKSNKIVTKSGRPAAKEYSGQNGWKDMINNEKLDLVYITTPWELHTPMALYAMEHGAHAASEVPIALTLEDCWKLVETSERTKKHCMMLENCCYDFFELLTLNMARQGMFGELVHAEGAYIHDLRDLNFSKTGYQNMWRLRMNGKHKANLYPTHGLGPVAQCLNINRGDKMDYLVSVATNDFMMNEIAKERAAKDDFYKEFVNLPYRGNMSTTTIKTNKGKTIMIQHDVTSPRPYSRIHLISGTKGVASKWPDPERIAFGHEWIKEEELKKLYDQYTPEIIRKIGDLAKQVGGHGGMDFMMDWRLIDCLRNGLPLDQDVYDAAAWSCIVPLTEKSIANRGNSVDIPDFTRGSWKTNAPVELTLKGGGTTGVIGVEKKGESKQLNVH